MNFIKKLFYKPVTTNYPPQVIPEKPLELINSLDSYLVMKHKEAVDTDSKLTVKLCQIRIDLQHLSTSAILGLLTRAIMPGHSYIPRSVAFFISADGTWNFLYGVRDFTGSDDVTVYSFIELLTRTNNAR